MNTPINPVFAGGAAAAAPAAPAVEAVTLVAQAPAEQPAAAPAAQPVEAPEVSTAARATPNFELRHAFSGGDMPEFDPKLPVIQYPSASHEGTQAAIRDTPNMSIASGEKLDRYATVIREGLGQSVMADDMNELRNREGAMFKQEVEVGGAYLGGFVPKFKVREDHKYSGEAARNLVRNSMQLGTVFSVPLWHSGFWVTLRTPSEGELLELYRQLSQDKTSLGRATYGLLYSSLTSYTAKVMSDFILNHMHSTSLKVDDVIETINYIKLPDYQLLMWGLACATWPNGYQYNRACITDVEKCQHIVTEKVNLARLLWEDTTSLTEQQKQHMTNRQKGSVTPEQVKTYTDAFLRGRNSTVSIGEELTFTMKMPMLAEYIDVGYKWINMLEEQYGRALNMPEKERNAYLLNHAQAQSMRQYGHFVHSLSVNGNEIDDLDDVVMILGDLSADDDVRAAFEEQVTKFQNDSIIAFIGIPNYECPKCKGMQRPTGLPGQKHELIVLDVSQTFFHLLMQKLAQIRER